MTIEEAVYDVFEIKKAANDETDLDEFFVLQKLNSYRAIVINQLYQLTGHLDYSWLQRHPQFSWEKVTAADDPNVITSSITLGKFKLPKVVSLPENLGLYQLTGSGGIRVYSQDDFATMMLRAEIEERHPDHGYYSIIGDVVYSFPYNMYGQAVLVADNPMDVPVIENNVQRDFAITDEYPSDSALMQQCILQVLTVDLKIADQQVSDIINDSQVQLKLMQNAGKQNAANSR